MKNIMIFMSTVFICSCSLVESRAAHNLTRCNEKTVYEQLDCLEKSLEIKAKILDELHNEDAPDYQIWKDKVAHECEGVYSNTLGDAISESLDCKHRLFDERISTLEKIK